MKKNLKSAPNFHLAHGAHEAYLTCDGKRLAHVKYGTCGKCVLVNHNRPWLKLGVLEILI